MLLNAAIRWHFFPLLQFCLQPFSSFHNTSYTSLVWHTHSQEIIIVEFIPINCFHSIYSHADTHVCTHTSFQCSCLLMWGIYPHALWQCKMWPLFISDTFPLSGSSPSVWGEIRIIFCLVKYKLSSWLCVSPQLPVCRDKVTLNTEYKPCLHCTCDHTIDYTRLLDSDQLFCSVCKTSTLLLCVWVCVYGQRNGRNVGEVSVKTNVKKCSNGWM